MLRLSHQRIHCTMLLICQKHIFIVGTMTIGEIKKLCKDYFRNDENKLQEELKTIIPDQQILRLRRDQMNICSNLSKYCGGARVILELQKKFKLKGDFDDMNQFLKTVGVPIDGGKGRCTHRWRKR